VNRYKVSGKLSIRDAVEAGDLEEIVVSNPGSLSGGLAPGVKPKSIKDCTVRLQCRGSAPSPGELPKPTETPITLTLEFDAPDLDSALEWGGQEIETRAAILSVLLLNRVEVESAINCVEITAGKREDLESGHSGEYSLAPVVIANDVFQHVMGGSVFEGKIHSKLAGSFRWFRKGMQNEFPEDAYLCFWIALEMIASEFAVGKSRFMLCPRCQEQFKICPNCNESTEVPAGISEGIITLFNDHLKWPKKKFRDLNKFRAKLMHGGTPVSEGFRKELIARNSQIIEALLKGYEVLIGSGTGPSIGPDTHPLRTRLLILPWGSQLRTNFSLPED
jgi:hypothetical protein